MIGPKLRALLDALDAQAATAGLPSFSELEASSRAARADGDRQAELDALQDMGARLRAVAIAARAAGELGGDSPYPDPAEPLAEAIDLFRQAVVAADSLAHRELRSRVRHQLGACCLEIGQLDEAARHLAESLQLWPPSAGPHLRYEIERDLGDCLASLEDDDGALERFRAALASTEELGDPFQRAITLAKIASVLDNLNRFEEALSSYEKARRQFEQIGLDQSLQAKIVVNRNQFHAEAIPDLVEDLDERAASVLERKRHHESLATLNRPDLVRYRHARHYIAVLDAIQHESRRSEAEAEITATASFLREWGQIRSGQRWAAAASSGSRVAARICIDYGLTAVDFLDDRVPAEQRLEWVAASLSAANRLDDSRSRVRLLVHRSYNLSDLGQTDRALEDSRRALELGRRLNDPNGESLALMAMSGLYNMTGRTDEALETLEQYREGPSDQELFRKADQSLLTLVHLNRGDYDQALEFGLLELDEARAEGDRSREAKALGNIGLIHGARGDHRAALEKHQEALALSRQLGERRAECSNVLNVGTAHLDLVQLDEASESLQEGLKIARELDLRPALESALGNLGHVHRMLGKNREATRLFAEAAQIAEARGHLVGCANAFQGMGNVYIQQQDLDQAIASFRRSLAVAREIDNPSLQAGVLCSLGNARLLRRELESALEHFEESMGLAREIGDRLTEGRSLRGMAAVLAASGEREEATRRARQALDLFEELGAVAERASALLMISMLSPLGDPASGGSETLDLVRRWTAIPTIDTEDSRAFLEAHREKLLTDEAIGLLEGLVRQGPDDGKLARHLELLKESRIDGIEASFATYSAQVQERVARRFDGWKRTPEAVSTIAKVLLWISQPDAESSRRFLEANKKELLTLNARTAIEILGKEDHGERFRAQEMFRLFELIREHGVGDAYAKFDTSLWQPE